MTSDHDKIITTLNLPDASQVCVVVRDLDKAIHHYESVLGIGPFVRPEIPYQDKYYLGKPIPDSEWVMGFASLGPVELELTQPVKGPSIYSDFIEQHGEGLHHIGFDIKDLDTRLELCHRLGIEVLCIGRTPAGGFAHLNTHTEGDLLVELIQRTARRA